MDNVLPLPPQLRVVAAPADALSPEQAAPTLVDHGGQVYRLANLVARLSPAQLALVDAAVPRTGQAAWDEAVAGGGRGDGGGLGFARLGH